jgi:general secretion pathway protein A
MAIYESYYHCQREPFSLSPDPSFLYAAPSHREALAQLHYLVQQRKGFAVVTGEVGTGKTMLLRSLIESVGPQVQTGYIFNPPRTREALYEAIAEELNVELGGHRNPVSALTRHFLESCTKDRTVVLIFDEAQSFDIPLLEEIRLLTNIETASAKLVQVILAGQTEFDTMIDSFELRALRQRLVFRYSLSPLNEQEATRYIAARFEAAGATRSPFTLSACEAVHKYSRGVPRLINVLCDNSLLAGYASDRAIVDDDLVEEAAIDLKLAAPGRSTRRQREFVVDGNDKPLRASRLGLLYALIIVCTILAVGIAAISTRAAQRTDSAPSIGASANGVRWSAMRSGGSLSCLLKSLES